MRRKRTRSRSAGSEALDESVSTTSSSLAGVTWSASSMRTPSTTTARDRIELSVCIHLMARPVAGSRVRRRDVLGGLLHEYFRAAA